MKLVDFEQEGVVFALSGLVNPERSTLRSQALEMGAEYRADWTPDCTLLVCAYPNTPKFRQVAGDCGTIVSKVKKTCSSRYFFFPLLHLFN